MSAGDVSLDEALDRLTRQARWAGPGLWLAWVFTEADAHVRTLRAALDAPSSVRFDVVDGPSALAALEGLFALDPSVRTVWVVALTPDEPTREGWTTLHLRMNERREALGRAFHGGVVFVGGPWLKAAARDAAPDLWSVRTQVLGVRPENIALRFDDLEGGISITFVPPYWRDAPPSDAQDRARSWFDDLKEQGGRAAPAHAIRMARALLDGGHLEDASELARLVQYEDKHPAIGARLEALMGSVRAATGDLQGALESYDRALQIDPEGLDSTMWRLERVNVLARLGRVPKALEEARMTAGILQNKGSQSVWVAFAAVGDCLAQLGRAAEAEAQFDQALSAALRPSSGADVWARANLMMRVGALRRAHDPEAGVALITKAIELYRTQLEPLGRSPKLRVHLADALMERAHASRLAGRSDLERVDLMEALSLVEPPEATDLDPTLAVLVALNAARLHALIATSGAPDAENHRRRAFELLDEHPRESLEAGFQVLHDQIRAFAR